MDNEGFNERQWKKSVASGHENYLDEEDCDTGKGLKSPPHLYDEWLTKKDINNRETERENVMAVNES